MAIIIPSKNIYEINNPKIRDNAINNVSVEQKVIAPSNEYETPVANLNEAIKLENITYTEDSSGLLNKSSFITDEYDEEFATIGLAYAELKLQFYRVKITIPKLTNNKVIDKLMIGVNDDGESNVKYTIIGDKTQASTKANIKASSGTNFVVNLTSQISIENPTTNTDTRYSKSDLKFTLSQSGGSVSNIKITATAEPQNISTIDNENIIIIENEDKYELEFTFLVGMESTTLSGEATWNSINNQTSPSTIYGNYEKFYAKEVEITFYGNTIGINLTNGSVTYGSGNKPHALRGNELLQDSGKVRYQDNTIISIDKHLANNVLVEYKNGKETATLLCDINDYYNESGEKVIDANGDEMVFRLHDQVIPMVFGANGKDQPMSKYQDNSAKVFEIVGSKIFYDGAVWQELTLQEFSK